MITLQFLGSASAFTLDPNNYQSNMLISTADQKHLLIDCGNDVRRALKDQGFSAEDIDAVYISHLHGDHIGGLEWLGFSRKFLSKKNMLSLYAHTEVLAGLWDKSLRGGMCSLADIEAKLEDFFKPVATDSAFTWQKIKFTLFKTKHVLVNDHFMPCYGLYFSLNGKNILISADTQFIPESLNQYFHSADVIFHDCETSVTRTTIHARYEELKKLPPEIKSKMWLYDYNDGEKPDAIRDGFKGYVVKGQKFTF